MRAGPLSGKRIVVTRPREHAVVLATLVREAGGEPLVFPAIEIRDPADPGAILALASRLEEFDFAVFISPTAVRQALRLLRSRRGDKPWPARLRVAAIGRGSLRELERAGFKDVLAPQSQADSEALLELPELARVEGRRIVIFRGEGGRALLGDALAARGATVHYAECYARARPRADAGTLLAAWSRGAVDAVTVSSGEGLVNLFEMLGESGRAWLQATPMFVPHARVAEKAAQLGVRDVTLAGPGDAQMLAALMAYFGRAQPRPHA